MKHKKIIKTVFWFLLFGLPLALIIWVGTVDYYGAGYAAGEEAGRDYGYALGTEDGARAGGKNGVVAGQALIKLRKIISSNKPETVPQPEIKPPEPEKILGKEKVFFNKGEYVKGYLNGYIPAAEKAYSDGYKSGYKESFNASIDSYEKELREILAAEEAKAEKTAAASDGEGNKEPPPQYSAPVEKKCDYVLNKNTMKFHFPTCSSAEQIKDGNREYFTGNREEVISRGFSPCGRCDP